MGPEKNLTVVPLHENHEFIHNCAILLNKEWKRSLEARLHNLEKCSHTFPVHLIMLEKLEDGLTAVIGHARLTFATGNPSVGWVESVVIEKSSRGKGYGKILMIETEEYARTRGFTELCLTTHDAQGFYGKLGYEFYTPAAAVSAYCNISNSSNRHVNTSEARVLRNGSPPAEAQGLGRETTSNEEETGRDSGRLKNLLQVCSDEVAETLNSQTVFEAATPSSPLPQPPPPPPPPLPFTRLVIEHHPNIVVYYMRKRL